MRNYAVEESPLGIYAGSVPSEKRLQSTVSTDESVFAAPNRVLIIITGGTICMRPSIEEGVNMSKLSCSSMEKYLKQLPEFADPSLPLFDVHEWPDLVDSSDINHIHWKKLATEIYSSYEQYRGFIILHGTDTLAYTASVLSFMLEDLDKPVVVTGAMLPMTHINTDAKRNVCISLLIAGFSHVKEVVVCFGSKILRGCRATKKDCSVMDAFDSPNSPPLGKVGIEVTVATSELRDVKRCGVMTPFLDISAESVCVVTVTPNFNPTILRHLASLETRPLGVILQLFGTGTAPTGNSRLREAIRMAVGAGITLIAVTQCHKGSCSLMTYHNGSILHDMGVIEGKDITTEAAFAKMAYLFGKKVSGDELRRLMEQDMRGEMTERVDRVTGQLLHRNLTLTSMQTCGDEGQIQEDLA